MFYQWSVVITDITPHVASHHFPDIKVHGANMGPTWVLSAPDGPHVGPINLAIKVVLPGVLCMFYQWNLVTANTTIHIAFHHLFFPLSVALVLGTVLPPVTSHTDPFRVLRSCKGIHPRPFSITLDVETSLQLHERLLRHGIPELFPKPTAIPSQIRIGSEIDPHFLVQILWWNVFAKNDDQVIRSFL